MTIDQLNKVLDEYTDSYINSQPPAERPALLMERADLEAELAEKLALQHNEQAYGLEVLL